MANLFPFRTPMAAPNTRAVDMELTPAIPTPRPQLFGNAWQRGGAMRKLGLAGGVLSDFAAGLRGQPVGYAGAMVDEELDQHRRDLARWMLPENLRDLYDLSPQTALARAFPAPQTPVKLGEGDSLVNPETGAPIVQGTPKPRIYNTGQSIVSVGPDGRSQVLYTDPKQPNQGRGTYEILTKEEVAGLGLPPGSYKRNSVTQDIVPVGRQKAQYTEFAGKSAQFANRTLAAHKTLSDLEDKSVTPQGVFAAQSGFGSEAERKARQAQREFVNAILRQESGAAIGKDEFVSAQQQYFPQPGDTRAVIEQKRAARMRAVQGLINASQGAYDEWYEAPPADQGDLRGFDDAWREYVKANPIFDPRSTADNPKINGGRRSFSQWFASQQGQNQQPRIRIDAQGNIIP